MDHVHHGLTPDRDVLLEEIAGLKALVDQLNAKLDATHTQRCVKCGTTIPGPDVPWALAKDLATERDELRTRLAKAQAIADAACAVVDSDTYKHPMLSRADAVKAGVAALHDAVSAYRASEGSRDA